MTTLSGGLTSATRRDPIAIALGYVREHAQVFGLTQSDISALALVRSDTSWEGTTHLVWDRVVGGIRAADSDLRANVARDGRLLNVDARAQGAFEVSTRPNLSAGAALGVAARDVGAPGLPPRAFAPHGRDKRTRFSNGAQARLELLGMPRAGRLTWSVVLHAPGPYVYRDLVDAGSGQVLRRQNLTFAANNATVYERYPGAPLGGTAHTVDLSPWLENPAAPTRLRGDNAHVFSDPNDHCTPASCAGPGPGEDVGPSAGTNFDYPLQTVTDSTGLCPPAPGCTWDHNTANSWQANRAQDATQAFYYVNKYHDHLKAPPIGFDEASGNFEFDNGSNGGAANDGLLVNTDDGANTNSGLPDASHQNNAFFTTGPDGTPGQMALYLQQPPTYSAVNIGDDADTIYHEYTHGLSNRLVTDPDGFGSLYYLQSAALGEGWSDWYAEDFLVSQGFVADHPGTSGEVTFDPYAPVRTQALDCAVGVSASICPGGATGHGGGYTLGDFERIRATGDPHADSEIWSETLWDLRTALGSATAERLVTDAMRLSPGQPSFLDMRDAILAADVAAFDGAHSATLWQVFAARGMGWKAVDLTARSIAAGDIVEDFSVPPPVRIRGVTNVQDPVPAGDGDGVPEPGETVSFDVPLTNPTATPITGVTATLGSTDPSVLIGQRSSPYPTLPGLGPATNSRRYTINIPSSATCGAPFPLRLDASTSAGSATGPFSLPTGGDGTINSPSASPAVAIPDASGAGVTTTLAVGPGLGRIRDLNVRIGSVTHPWDGDLRFRVQSPSGTVVRFVDRPGGATNKGADFTNTVVDDEATNGPIGDVGTPPYTGSFKPHGDPLSKFDGEDPNGTWLLNVQDLAPGDVGQLNSWGLDITPATCDASSVAPPPTATTGGVDGVTASAATLHGDVEPGAVSATQFAFQYGTLTSYGKQTVPTSAHGGLEYSALSGLPPSTRYHYRIVALRAGLIDAVGDDHEFSTAPPPRTLTVRRAGRGAGTITSSPAAINCGSRCTHAFAFGKLVTLYAKPARGSTFGGWSGACSGKRGCLVKMTLTRTVTATFKKKQKKHKK